MLCIQKTKKRRKIDIILALKCSSEEFEKSRPNWTKGPITSQGKAELLYTVHAS